jgi:MraZ protein
MFLGAASLTLDAKGRLAIPARHRPQLAEGTDGTLVLTAHPHRCLLIYPKGAWEPMCAKVMDKPNLDRDSAAMKRLLLGHAREESLDSAGRVLVAPELRAWAGMDTEEQRQVWLVGQGTHFELWSDEGWKAQQSVMDTLATQTPGVFADLVL